MLAAATTCELIEPGATATAHLRSSPCATAELASMSLRKSSLGIGSSIDRQWTGYPELIADFGF